MLGRRHVLAALGAVAAAPAAGAGRRPPDLSGTWTNAWYTYLERPRGFKSLVVTPAEAEAFEAPRRAHRGELIVKEDVLGQAESEFPDNGPGMARINGEIRSSWIVDPPDGRVPWIEAARKRIPDDEDHAYDDVAQRPTDERCLTAPGMVAPMINSHDTNVVQIVQTRDSVAFVSEKNHDVRIVRIGKTAGPALGHWAGVSVGRWEGDTLVVETTGLRPGITKVSDALYLSDKARVVERFTRPSPAVLMCAFEVEDPTLFTRPWRAEMVFRPAEGLIYEYACHEGNQSLPSILSAARQGRQDR